MSKKINDELVIFVSEIVFTDETPDWIIESALSCLNCPTESYERTVRAVRFFNQLDGYLKTF